MTQAADPPTPRPPADPAGRFEWDMTPDRLGEMRASVRSLVVRCGLGDAVATDAEIAVDEAMQNVLRHAYLGRTPARIDLTAWIDDDHLWVEIRDYAEPVDLDTIRPRDWDPDRPGGFGTRLIQSVMDRVAYAHAPDGRGNIVTLGRRLSRAANGGEHLG